MDASYRRLYEGSGQDIDEPHGGGHSLDTDGFVEYWEWKVILHELTNGSLKEQDYILEHVNWIAFMNELAFRKDLKDYQSAIIKRYTEANRA